MRWIATGAASVVFLASAGASAQQTRQCADAAVTREIDRALDDRLHHRELAGLERLQTLARHCATPRVLAQLALAEHGLGMMRQAYRHLQDALALGEDRWVESRRALLEGALREITERLPRLDPQTNVQGAELRVEGAVVGNLPLREPHVLLDGRCTLELSAPGYVTLRREVTVNDGGVFREMLVLSRQLRPSTVTPPVGGRGRHDPGEGRSTSGDDARRVLGWTAVGAGVVLGALGVWQLVRWLEQGDESGLATVTSPGELGAWARFQRDYNPAGRYSGDEVCGLANAVATSDAESVRNLCEEHRSSAAMALGFGAAGVLTGVLGAVILATMPNRAPARRANLQLGPWFTPTTRGASLSVEF